MSTGTGAWPWTASSGTRARSILIGCDDAAGVYDSGVFDVGGLPATTVPALPGPFFVQMAGHHGGGRRVPSPVLAAVMP